MDIIVLFVPRPSLLACSVAIPNVARNFGLMAVSGAPSFATAKEKVHFSASILTLISRLTVL